MKTELEFCSYDRRDYCKTIGELIDSIPLDKSIFYWDAILLMIITCHLCIKG